MVDLPTNRLELPYDLNKTASVVEWLERLTTEREVVGSSPRPGHTKVFKNGTSSFPVWRSTFGDSAWLFHVELITWYCLHD